jgi:hypothetical protein
MSPKFRLLYLFLGFAGLLCSINYIITNFPAISSSTVLLITVPGLVFFFLAYKTYPAAENKCQEASIVSERN